MSKLKSVFGVTAIVAVGALVGCGGSSDSSSTSTPPADTNATSNSAPAPDTDSGSDATTVALFNSAGCSGCHTFKPADASGTVGPDLDTTAMTEDQIKTQIENGGGPMPAYSSQLSTEEIDSLAELISDNAK